MEITQDFEQLSRFIDEKAMAPTAIFVALKMLQSMTAIKINSWEKIVFSISS